MKILRFGSYCKRRILQKRRRIEEKKQGKRKEKWDRRKESWIPRIGFRKVDATCEAKVRGSQRLPEVKWHRVPNLISNLLSVRTWFLNDVNTWGYVWIRRNICTGQVMSPTYHLNVLSGFEWGWEGYIIVCSNDINVIWKIEKKNVMVIILALRRIIGQVVGNFQPYLNSKVSPKKLRSANTQNVIDD